MLASRCRYVDKRGNWHALYHAANGSQHTHCSTARVASHVFSSDRGKTWSALDPPVEPYKPVVVWEDRPAEPQVYATMERPHVYADPASGDLSHLGVPKARFELAIS